MALRKLAVILVFLTLTTFAFSQDIDNLPKTNEYRLDLLIDFSKHKLFGKCEITISNDTKHPIEQIPIILYRLLSVKNVENESSEPMLFTQEVVSISGWEEIQVNFIKIPLSKTLSPGEQIKIKLEYEGFLFGYAAEGWMYVKDHIDRNFTIIRTDGFGYPVIGYPNEGKMMIISQEKYDYSLNVTVPSDMTVVTGGELTGRTKTDHETTFTFRSKKPSWRLDIAISDYQIIGKDENKIYYFANDSLGAQKNLSALQASFELYTQWFGPLDNYLGFSIIEVPEGYSSQKDVAAIILSADNFNESKEMTTIYHEIAHSWNVTNLDAQPCRFESEGFAQFLQYLLLEKLDDKQNAVSDAAQRYLDRVRTAFNEKKEYQTIPIKDYGIHGMTDYSYTLGMVVFAIFYEIVGQDQFNEIIGSFYSANQSKGTTLDEFITHCKKSAPIKLEVFFNDWIYTTKGVSLVMDGKSFNELRNFYIKN